MNGETTALRALAKAYGVQRQWRAADGTRRIVSDETLLAVVRALGAPLHSASDAPDALRAYQAARSARVVEPVSVQWGDDALALDVRFPPGAATHDLHLTLDAEDGTKAEWSAADGALAPVPTADPETQRVTLPTPLPLGVHRLHVEAGGARGDATVIAAPFRLPSGPRSWGLFAPVYALYDDNQESTGDLAAFDRFSRWAGSHGARVIGTLPLLATFFGAGEEPNDPSPYAPVSRRHWNEVYVDLTAVPEVEAGITITEPSPGALVDLSALARAKRPVLESAAARLEDLPTRRDAYERWLELRPDVVAYARFRAALERAGPGASADPAVDESGARYHSYVQWVVESQLHALADRMRERDQELYLDLPIGAHPEGFDVVTEDGLFARGASVGAPPDGFFAGGQQWGFPPVLPAAARATGHAYLRECIATHVRVARRLRVDHVMGFHRMWWVPSGAPPADGAYVSYPAEEQYAVLTLTAARAHGRVVGENLGTVPPETNRALRRHGILGMYVVPFELDATREEPLRDPTARELACLDTHDTPTFLAWWHDLAPRERGALLQRLRHVGCLDTTYGEGVDPEDVLGALLAYLGTTRAEVVLATLEDLWLEVEAQNVPGTTSAERPNFRRRAAHSLDELEQATTVSDALYRLDAARREGARQRA